MSILDKSSLVMIPSGYKEDKLYSVKPRNGDGDFTFTRSSTGTRVNADGYIEEVPWNLITYSEDFSNSSYIKDSGITIGTTNNVSPISNNTATQINATNSGRIYKNVTSAEYRTSVYLKAGTFAYFKVVGQNVDLNLGTISSVYPADIEDVGNGWYRISISYVASIRPFQIQAFPDNTYSTHTTSGNYFVWGAMLNYGDTTKPYIKTTDRLDIPRLDYSGGATSPTLLLEPQITNLITYSESFDNAAWTKSGTTITANNTTSPDGTTNADKIIASSGLSIKIAYQVISSTNSVAHTVSAFYKADEYSYAFLRVGGQTPSPYVIYNLLNQSVVSTANATSTKIEDYGSGWYRVSMTYTANSVTNAPNISFLPTSGYTLDSANQPSYNGDGSSGGYIYGAQLEQGSYPTSYIPTLGTSVTRTLESGIITSATDLIGQTQGTLYSEFDLTEDNNFTFVEINLGNSTNNRILAYRSVSNIQFVVQVGGVIEINNSTLVTFLDTNKIAVTYQTDDFKIYLNGSLVKTYTSGNIPSGFDTIDLQDNNLNGKKQGVKSLILFKEILTNDELETLTTI